MRKLCATVLTVTVCWQPLSAAALDDPRGPLARSTAREAARVAALPADEFDTPGWSAVRALDPGKNIVITTADETIRGSFVSADSGTLTLRTGDTPGK